MSTCTASSCSLGCVTNQPNLPHSPSCSSQSKIYDKTRYRSALKQTNWLTLFSSHFASAAANVSSNGLVGDRAAGVTLGHVLLSERSCGIHSLVENTFQYNVHCCTMNISIQWTFLFHEHFCTMHNSVPWTFLYSEHFCTVNISVPWTFLLPSNDKSLLQRFDSTTVFIRIENLFFII